MNLQQLQTDPAAIEILAVRAQALAAQTTHAAQVSGEALVVFQLGGSAYTIPAHAIREVLPLDRYTPLPATPACVLGLINLRGRPLAAIDIRPLLGISAVPLPADTWLLIVSAQGVEVGLVADQVLGVQPSAGTLSPTFSAVAGKSVAWVRGVDRELRLQIDPDGLLADPRLANDTAQIL